MSRSPERRRLPRASRAVIRDGRHSLGRASRDVTTFRILQHGSYCCMHYVCGVVLHGLNRVRCMMISFHVLAFWYTSWFVFVCIVFRHTYVVG